MRRHALGIIGIVAFVVGVAAHCVADDQDGTMQAVSGSGTRIGAVLLSIWLAFPQISRVPAWMYKSGLISALVIAIRPKAAFVILPALALIWLLRPRPKPSQARHTNPTRKRGNDT